MVNSNSEPDRKGCGNMVTIEKLSNENEFELVEHFKHKDMIPFLAPYIRKKTPVMTGYKASLILFTIGLGVMFGYQGVHDIGRALLYLIGGFWGAVILVPFHELIHGFVYRLYGAKDVRYHAEPKKFMFYAVAHLYAIDGKRFLNVAAAPTVAIFVLMIVLTILYPVYSLAFMTVQVMNLLMAGGDVALINYLYVNREKTVYTYDDDELGVTYIYIKKE